jgi:TPR repeat protein
MTNVVKDYYSALNMLGCMYDKKRQFDLALECYLKSSKGCDIALFNYGALLVQLNKYQIKSKENDEKFNEIKQIVEIYIEKYPNDFDGYYELGNLYSWKDEHIKYEYWEKAFNLGMYKVFDQLSYYYKRQIEESSSPQERSGLINKLRVMADKTYDKILLENNNENSNQLSKECINKLGVLFSTPNSYIIRDYNKAVKLWKISTSIYIDNNNGFYNLGLSYLYGEGCEKDLNKAFSHFMKSLEDPDSQREIGMFYENGLIDETPKNVDLAKEWYIKAANHKYTPDYESCIKIVNLSNDIKEKSKYYLKAINSIRYSQSKTKEYDKLKIPKDVLLYWHDKINEKIPTLKQRIIELECRPPIEGGKLYQNALHNFSKNI